MKKTLWLTSLEKDAENVQKFMAQMKKFGMELNGHFWLNEPGKMSWMGPRKELLDEKVAMWGILASEKSLQDPDTMYGLSLLTLTVQAARGLGFPISIFQKDGVPVTPEQLPTPLKGVDVFKADQAGLGAKLVAQLHKPPKKIDPAYRMDLYASPQLGQWFEVGPVEETWPGAMFGVSGAEILFHAVGPNGKLPSETVLNYALKGMKLNLGEKEYAAWAVQNEMDTDTSYFVKVEGEPDSVIFGPYSENDEADVYVVGLK